MGVTRVAGPPKDEFVGRGGLLVLDNLQHGNALLERPPDTRRGYG